MIGAGSPLILVIGVALLLLLAAAMALTLWDFDRSKIQVSDRMKRAPVLDKQRDFALQLGMRVETWLWIRVAATLLGLFLGWKSGIFLLYVVAPAFFFFGIRFMLAGRAASRQLRMERAFLQRLRDLRDRMSISNQSLDHALQEIGRNPGKDLEYMLSPLARGGSVLANIVEVGIRSRSPIIEYACGVLIWARSRSLDSLIEAIDEILLPVGEAQLEVQEESMVTLTQQRAVTFAMTGLMLAMLMVVTTTSNFRTFYQGTFGNVILFIVVAMFMFLVFILGIIVRVGSWTRWDLRKLARQQERFGA
jgi:hypothetical protein